MNFLYILLGVIAVLVVGVIIIYNKFITLKTRKEEAWADIDVQLKRRYDLIPNLINTVKGYATHEKETFEKITEARTLAMQGGTMEEQAQNENMLTGALKSLFAVSENYPELKANQNFLELQRELSDTENKIQSARRFYNTVVKDLNIAIQSFPTNLIANIFKIKIGEFFDLDENPAERENVKVDF